MQGVAQSEGERRRASGQIKALESQLAVIDRFQASDYSALAQTVGFAVDGEADGANGKPPAAEAESGAAP